MVPPATIGRTTGPIPQLRHRAIRRPQLCNTLLSAAGVANFLDAATNTYVISAGQYTVNYDIGSIGTVSGASLSIGSGASVTFNSNETLSNLTLGANGQASFTAATQFTANIGALNIGIGASLDIADSLVYLDNTATPFATAQGFWANGYNLNSINSQAPGIVGDWTGLSGVTSSSAVASYSANGDFKTTLGVYDGSYAAANGIASGPGANENATGAAASPNLSSNQLLIRTTQTGDMNGDGKVNNYDLSVFTNFGFYSSGATTTRGIQVGDFNGDGVVNDNDLLIFNTAGNYLAPAVTPTTGSAGSIHATAGSPFTGQVATFSSSAAYSTPLNYSASIDWGDGTSVDSTSSHDAAHAVTITGDATSGFAVGGMHTFASPATGGHATVTVMHTPSGLSGSASVPVTVAPTTLDASLTPLYTRAGSSYNGVIAAFTDSNTAAHATDFTTTVDYGDGNGPVAAIVQPTNIPGAFRVMGHVTYGLEGSMAMTVNVHDNAGGGSGSAGGSGNVAPSLMSAQGVLGIKGYREGQSFSGEVATFRDSNHTASAGPYSATINWMGDGGLAEPANISGIGGGKFAVFANGHRFKEEGNQMFSVSIHAGAHVLLAVGTADVLDAKFQGDGDTNATNLPIGQTQGPPWIMDDSSVVATFKDDFVDEANPQYSAVIHWGDGNTSTGTITPTGLEGAYYVSGGHTYQRPTAEGWVAIKDDGITRAIIRMGASFSNVQAVPSTDLPPKLADDSIQPSDPGTSDDPGGTGGGGGSSDTSSNTNDTNDPPQPTPPTTDDTGTLELTGQPVLAVEGQGIYPGTLVGTFNDSQTLSDPTNPDSPPLNDGNYAATATLPNGDDLPVSVSGSNGSYTIRTLASTQPFAEETTSDQSISLTLQQGTRTAVSSSVLRVTDAPLSADGPSRKLQMQAGQSQTQTVAAFHDTDPGATTGDFAALIDWGDGTTPSNGIIQSVAGVFTVLGTHNYITPSDPSETGGFAVKTTITDTEGHDIADPGPGRGKCIAPAVAVVAPPGKFKIVMDQLSFGSVGVTRDSDGRIDLNKQWEDGFNGDISGNDDRFHTPQGYKINDPRSAPGHDSFVGLSVTFRIMGDAGQNIPDGKYYIDGQDSSALGLDWQGQATARTLNGATVLTADLSPDSKLPDTINSVDLNIIWSISCLDANGNPVETETTKSSNHLYITGVAAPNAYETVLALGCDAATGFKPGDVTSNQAVTDAIWSKFALGNDTADLTSVDGSILTFNHEDPVASTTAGLLVVGHGQCDAFSNLLVDTLAAQGVSASAKKVVASNLDKYQWFRVKPMAAQGSSGEAYVPPFNRYSFHALVDVSAYPDRLYDPSYGAYSEATATATALQTFEYTNVTGIYDKIAGQWINDTQAATGQQYNLTFL